MKYFAAIGTDGTNHVVWGLGHTPKEALKEAKAEFDNLKYSPEEFQTVEITQEQDKMVREEGEVSCKVLGIKVS